MVRKNYNKKQSNRKGSIMTLNEIIKIQNEKEKHILKIRNE